MSNPAPTPEALPTSGGSWRRTADGRLVRADRKATAPVATTPNKPKPKKTPTAKE